MELNLKDILNTAAPTATLVFAAWIFLGLVSSRLQSAIDRCQALADEYRRGHAQEERKRHICEQIRLYRERSRQLQKTMGLGMIAAIFLILTLMNATVSMIRPDLLFLAQISIGCSLGGMLLLMLAVAFMLSENAKLPKALESEVGDIPEVEAIGEGPASS